MNTEQMAYVWVRTGEHRPPLKGETFLGYRGFPEMARFSFSEQCFDILRGEKVPVKSVAHEGDPCIACGLEHDRVLPGPCRGKVVTGVFLDDDGRKK